MTGYVWAHSALSARAEGALAAPLSEPPGRRPDHDHEHGRTGEKRSRGEPRNLASAMKCTDLRGSSADYAATGWCAAPQPSHTGSIGALGSPLAVRFRSLPGSRRGPRRHAPRPAPLARGRGRPMLLRIPGRVRLYDGGRRDGRAHHSSARAKRPSRRHDRAPPASAGVVTRAQTVQTVMSWP